MEKRIRSAWNRGPVMPSACWLGRVILWHSQLNSRGGERINFGFSLSTLPSLAPTHTRRHTRSRNNATIWPEVPSLRTPSMESSTR